MRGVNVVFGRSKGLHRVGRGRYTLGQIGLRLLSRGFNVTVLARRQFPPYENEGGRNSKGKSPLSSLHHKAVTLGLQDRHHREERRWFTLGQLG